MHHSLVRASISEKRKWAAVLLTQISKTLYGSPDAKEKEALRFSQCVEDSAELNSALDALIIEN